METTINVVGSGLAGSIVARLLRAEGFDVLVIDDNDMFSGSKASSNLFISSWLKKFSSTEAANGIAILERLFGANDLAVPAITSKIDQPFSGGIAAAGKVRHIHQKHILVEAEYKCSVGQVSLEGAYLQNGQFLAGPTVVCTGYRAGELIPGLKVDVKVGHAMFIDGVLAQGQSKLSLVSPYVHQKLYQYDENTIYYADSVAVTREKYKANSNALLIRTKERAEKVLGRQLSSLQIKEVKVGYRPFVAGHDFGYINEVRPSVFVINGGGKNGMVAYGHAASKVVDILKQRRAS